MAPGHYEARQRSLIVKYVIYIFSVEVYRISPLEFAPKSSPRCVLLLKAFRNTDWDVRSYKVKEGGQNFLLLDLSSKTQSVIPQNLKSKPKIDEHNIWNKHLIPIWYRNELVSQNLNSDSIFPANSPPKIHSAQCYW